MKDDFNQVVQDLDARRASPLVAAKKMLVPTRAAAVEGLKEFEKAVAKRRPVFETAQAKYAAAAARGVVHRDLRCHLQEIFGSQYGGGCLTGGVVAWQDLLRQIDGLTESDLAQGIPERLAGRPAALRGATGRLEDLVRFVEQDLRELEEMVRDAPATQAATMREPAPRPVSIQVETEFLKGPAL